MEKLKLFNITPNVLPVLFPSYEPELFPGLIYRMIKPRIVLLIFVSGKVVLTGEVIVVMKMSQTVSFNTSMSF